MTKLTNSSRPFEMRLGGATEEELRRFLAAELLEESGRRDLSFDRLTILGRRLRSRSDDTVDGIVADWLVEKQSSQALEAAAWLLSAYWTEQREAPAALVERFAQALTADRPAQENALPALVAALGSAYRARCSDDSKGRIREALARLPERWPASRWPAWVVRIRNDVVGTA
jgi:hypothetical protein